ncbi:kinase-like domain-containing protein [Echria macrotheca]|uniref:Kinase-like domain-containing protein n=1 Tax=Echria macrotheca TaxID=438768 RepID=A0AAJ0B9M3_9PEZI|nr:kinase-like domain-containing protein [Echria macrotheca]
MADAGDGWLTVMPTKTSGMDRLSRSQLETYERQVLKEWEASRGHWSGIGKHTGTTQQDFVEAKKIHSRFKPAHDRVLGSGSYGVVEKVNFFHNNKTVCLARKHIQYRRGYSIQFLREEANVMEKLDHDHIVKLVGTYCVRPNELYILLWPVAVCNLDNLFNDLDLLKLGQGDRDDIVSRLHTLDLQDFRAIEQTHPASQTHESRGNCPLAYLRQIVGCITRAVSYCHEANIRHLDLKPSNILLNPGGVYLADFGIAKDVSDRDRTKTMGQQGTPKWRAPEIHSSRDEWSMKAADVYSLGLVILNIATVLYGGSMAEFDSVVDDLTARGRAEKLAQYHTKLEALALATQQVEDVNAPSFAPKHLVSLTSRMLSSNPSMRPIVDQVDTELVELGGIDQIYHSPCCKKSSRFVTDRMNTRYRQVIAERDRLRKEYEPVAKRLEVLERMDETYESRIQNERRAQAEKIAQLQKQLEKEREANKKLETLLAETQRAKKPMPRGIPVLAERKLSIGSPSANGLYIRTKHTGITSAVPQARPEGPMPSCNTRPSYSQTASAPGGLGTVPPSARRQQEAVADRMRDCSVPTPALPGSPVPEAGYPIRTRGSGSKLPRAVNPATPIRSNTPSLNRDPSSTDSTQYSMTSSTFSRLSLSKYAESAANTSVAGTPAIGSPPVAETSWGHLRRPSNANEQRDQARPEARAEQVTSGLGLGIMERRESVSHESVVSVHDTGSVVSSGAVPGISSPVLSGSAFSSPRAVHAVPDIPAGGVKVPSLPTAKSWADVARRRVTGSHLK